MIIKAEDYFDVLDLVEKNVRFESTAVKSVWGVDIIGFGRKIKQDGIDIDEARFLCCNDLEKISFVLKDNVPLFEGFNSRQKVLIIFIVFMFLRANKTNYVIFKNIAQRLYENNFSNFLFLKDLDDAIFDDNTLKTIIRFYKNEHNNDDGNTN